MVNNTIRTPTANAVQRRVLNSTPGAYGAQPVPYSAHPQDAQRAQDLIDAQYGSQEQALQQALRSLGINFQNQLTTANQFGEIQGENIEQIYDNLMSQVRGNNADINDVYRRTGQNTGALLGRSETRLQEAGQAVQDRLAGRAGDLGLDQALQGQGVTDSQNTLDQLTSALDVNRTGAVNNIVNLGANREAVGIQALTDVGREGAQEQVNLIGLVGSLIGEAQLGYTEELATALSDLVGLQGEKGAEFRATLADLADARTERERQAALDQLMEDIQRGQLEIAQGQFGLQEREFDFAVEQQRFNNSMAISDLGLRREALQMQQRELEQAILLANDPLQQQLAQLELDKVRAEISRIEAETSQTNAVTATVGTTAEATRYTGQNGVQQYVNDNWGGNPNYYDGFLNVLEAATATNTSLDPKTVALQLINPSSGAYSPELFEGVPQDVMVEMINIMYGDYASYGGGGAPVGAPSGGSGFGTTP